MAESADSGLKERQLLHRGSFAVGTLAGFVLSSIFPAPSSYLRTLIVHLLDILVVLLVWTVIVIISFCAYKIVVDKDTLFFSNVYAAVKSIRQNIPTEPVIIGKEHVVELVSPSSEFAARPYPFVHETGKESVHSRLSSPSSPSLFSATSKKSGDSSSPIDRSRSRSPTKTVETPSNEQFSFRPYDSYDKDRENINTTKRSQATPSSSAGKPTKSKENDALSGSTTAKRSNSASSPTVSASPTRDPNKIPLLAAYVRPEPNAPWTKLDGKGLTLKITVDGLLLDDETGSRGGDLKAWMLSLIEHDVSGHSVMRATTQTNPALQVVYVFHEDERWKVTLGLHALKREQQGHGLRVKVVDGLKILGDIEG
ncbi:hypothetical protein V1525DRAFT_421430 [Lipomyces kononenkoae]|uniref:Uncharacterized protein n=1 Tax=Lipomyces kononenkoae TaxID=34357 RepID=A0ACC3SVC9_LIPKO